MPLWKWCSLVEVWAFRNCDPENHDKLSRDLNRAVDFTWLRGWGGADEPGITDPDRWQENKPGETLLSVHRKRKGG